MLRTILLAAAAALTLGACGQQGSGPPLPEAQDGAMNAPSQQQAASAEGQAMLTPAQREQLESLVVSYLDEAVRRNGNGMTTASAFTDEIADLQPGTDHRWQVDLVGGATYRILGGCDNECSNLDIELIDSRGGVVASDLSPNDFPVVNFTPSASGSYIVRIMMQACSVAPCYAGARVMSAGGGQPS